MQQHRLLGLAILCIGNAAARKLDVGSIIDFFLNQQTRLRRMHLAYGIAQLILFSLQDNELLK
jgi:hypothetical protein